MTTLSADEMARVRSEVGDVLLSYGALPYFRVRSVYDLIRDTVVSSTVTPTTSSTAVTAAGAVVLVLASTTDYAAGQRVVIDCDDARETVTVRALTGGGISVVCTRLHAGVYPVEVESALTIVRGLLSDLITCEQADRDALASAGLKKVDEVEWFGGNGELSIAQTISRRRAMLREALVSALGLTAIWREHQARVGNGGAVEVY